MNLFKELGIYHSILADKDENENAHKFINSFVEEQKNEFTKSIGFFDKDVESFLEINAPSGPRGDKKPPNVMQHYSKGKISRNKINVLKKKIGELL